MVPDAVQVSGSDSDERKEEVFNAFRDGSVRVMVTKPVIGAWGLNWQHCAHQTFFPSHSFEQYYQAVRRSWRFGQTRPVVIDIVSSQGELGVVQSIERKSEQAEQMFKNLVDLMNSEIKPKRKTEKLKKAEIPTWL
jgi:RecG-like helicase